MINVAVVGFGFMGMIHTGNLLKNTKVHLSAIVDKHTDNILQKLEVQSGNFSAEKYDAEELSKVKIYNNITDCLKEQQPDACIISVHTNLHFEMAKFALEAGAHVFLEKPFCLDVEQGHQLIELALAKNRILMVGHVVRFMPAYQVLKSWIDNGEYGDLEFLSMSRFSGVPIWGQWKDRQKDFGSSGGALFDLVIHDIDFAQWVCGVPSGVNANILPGKLSNYDYVSALWNYSGKKLHVKIEGGNTFHPTYPFSASFTARFNNVSALYSSNDPANIILATDSGTKPLPVGDANEGFSGEINYFIDCIHNNEQPVLCHPESALETIKLCYSHIN